MWGTGSGHGPPYEQVCGQVCTAVLAKLSCYLAADVLPDDCKGLLAEELSTAGGEGGVRKPGQGTWTGERQE